MWDGLFCLPHGERPAPGAPHRRSNDGVSFDDNAWLLARIVRHCAPHNAGHHSAWQKKVSALDKLSVASRAFVEMTPGDDRRWPRWQLQ